MKLIYCIFILFAIIGFRPTQLQAQIGEPRVGLRTGSYTGISVSTLFDNDVAFEGILGVRERGTILTLRQIHYLPLANVWSDQFKWYYGGGLHVGFSKFEMEQDWIRISKNNPSLNHQVFCFGANGVLGLEYTLDRFPFSIGVETIPFIELRKSRNLRIGNNGLSLTVRYNINSGYLKSNRSKKE